MECLGRTGNTKFEANVWGFSVDTGRGECMGFTANTNLKENDPTP